MRVFLGVKAKKAVDCPIYFLLKWDGKSDSIQKVILFCQNSLYNKKVQNFQKNVHNLDYKGMHFFQDLKK